MRRLALVAVAVAACGASTTHTHTPQRVFVCGLGYCGLRAADAFHEAYPSCAVAGSVRSAEKAAALRSARPWLETFVFDLDATYRGLDEAGAAALGASTHVVATMPPIADGDEDPLLALHGVPEGAWACYLSTTGVYGDHGGQWIDETAEVRAADARSRARIAAEARYLEREGVVFRLGGIYGPGRSLLDKARAVPTRADAPGKFVNRIFVDDVAGAAVAAAAADVRSEVFNVVDDLPAPRAEVLAFAQTLAKHPPPPADAPSRAPLRAARSSGSKRCSNAKLREVYDLRAPTYEEGLATIHAAALLESPESGLS